MPDRGDGVRYVGVFPTADAPDGPSFVYTVGLARRGLPELVVYGLPPKTARDVLLSAVRGIEDVIATIPPRTRLSGVLRGHDVALEGATTSTFDSRVERGAHEIHEALRETGDDAVEVRQLFVPDADGLFPWDEGCDPAYAAKQWWPAFLPTVGLGAGPN